MTKEEPLFIVCSQRLRDCRIANDQTLDQIATFLRVSKARVSRWENGKTQKIPLSVIEQLARLWNVSPVWLMGKDVAKYMSASAEEAEADNVIFEAAVNLLRQLPEDEQKTILSVIRSIADKYSQGSG